MFSRLYNNPVDDNVKCGTVDTHLSSQHSTLTRQTLMNNTQFLQTSQSNIEDQCGGTSMTQITPSNDSQHQTFSALNPYFDKNTSELSSSQITSELIEQLLKLRAAASSSSAGSSHQPEAGAGVINSHINSFSDDADYKPHINEHSVTDPPTSAPFVKCLQTLDNGEEAVSYTHLTLPTICSV